MITFNKQDVLLNQKAANKFDAIKLVAAHLVANGKVEQEYTDGMLAREQQIATYLDNGVAIPHGVPETRKYVKQTGVAVVQFPEGVEWGDDGEVAYLAFGIASKNEEHLAILKAITKVIGDEEVAQQLAKTTDLDEFVSLLQADAAGAKATSLSPEKVTVAQLATSLFQQQLVDAPFLTAVVEAPVLVTNNGVVLASAAQGCKANAVAATKVNYQVNGKAVSAVLVASVNSPLAAQEVFGLVNSYTGELASLATAAKEVKFVSLDATASSATAATQQAAPAVQATPAPAQPAPEASVSNEEAVEAVFVIHNEHGLHARPATNLVELVKGYDAKVTVQNLSNGSAAVNCKSMVKVISLGAAKDAQLKFVATGPEAAQVISAIGEAIEQGLGE